MSRIYLRAFEPEDYHITHKWRQDKEITELLGGNHFFVSKEREKQWVASKATDDKNSIYLAICLLSTDEMIGYVSLVNIDLRNSKADIGGILIGDKKLWRRGYSKEAYIELISYIFNEYPINKVSNYCLEEHEDTKKTKESLGYRQDGEMRDDIYKNGEYKNLLVFSILREEFAVK